MKWRVFSPKILLTNDTFYYLIGLILFREIVGNRAM